MSVVFRGLNWFSVVSTWFSVVSTWFGRGLNMVFRGLNMVFRGLNMVFRGLNKVVPGCPHRPCCRQACRHDLCLSLFGSEIMNDDGFRHTRSPKHHTTDIQHRKLIDEVLLNSGPKNDNVSSKNAQQLKTNTTERPQHTHKHIP